MKNSTRWFGWIVVITALHMSEQLVFGIGELAIIKRILAVYYGWFQQPDYATVVLVTIIATLVNALMFGLLMGGKWRGISLGFMGFLGLGEVHHVIEAIHARGYNPGLITAIPFMVFGGLLLAAVVRERHEEVANAASQAVVAKV